jgi:hypothetical protein
VKEQRPLKRVLTSIEAGIPFTHQMTDPLRKKKFLQSCQKHCTSSVNPDLWVLRAFSRRSNMQVDFIGTTLI